MFDDDSPIIASEIVRIISLFSFYLFLTATLEFVVSPFTTIKTVGSEFVFFSLYLAALAC